MTPTFDEDGAINPATYTQKQAWSDTIKLLVKMCEVNGIEPPDMHGKGVLENGHGAYGYYRPGKLVVNVAHCALPVRGKPIRRFSYTGWKSDRTVPGVGAHELGHHFDYMIGLRDGHFTPTKHFRRGASTNENWEWIVANEPRSHQLRAVTRRKFRGGVQAVCAQSEFASVGMAQATQIFYSGAET